MREQLTSGYLPLEFDTSGLASSESFLIATAFLILFIALPPTFAVLARLLGLDWFDDTEIRQICIRKNRQIFILHWSLLLIFMFYLQDGYQDFKSCANAIDLSFLTLSLWLQIIISSQIIGHCYYFILVISINIEEVSYLSVSVSNFWIRIYWLFIKNNVFNFILSIHIVNFLFNSATSIFFNIVSMIHK